MVPTVKKQKTNSTVNYPEKFQLTPRCVENMSLPRGEGEYGRELPMERRRLTVWGTSAEMGDPEVILGNPIGLVLERLTVPDLC